MEAVGVSQGWKWWWWHRDGGYSSSGAAKMTQYSYNGNGCGVTGMEKIVIAGG